MCDDVINVVPRRAVEVVWWRQQAAREFESTRRSEQKKKKIESSQKFQKRNRLCFCCCCVVPLADRCSRQASLVPLATSQLPLPATSQLLINTFDDVITKHCTRSASSACPSSSGGYFHVFVMSISISTRIGRKSFHATIPIVSLAQAANSTAFKHACQNLLTW